MNLVRNPGLDLPVLPADTKVLHTKPELFRATATQGESFVRSVVIDAPGMKSLKQCLDVVDEEIDRLTDLCGPAVEVVPHEWGFIPASPANPQQRLGKVGEQLIPDDYALVALVDTIRGKQFTKKSPETPGVGTQLRDGLNAYFETTAARPFLDDLSFWQFLHVPGEKSADDKAVLVDIEPRLHRPRRLRHAAQRAGILVGEANAHIFPIL